ncbi:MULTISPECIES: ParB N-terminal domain-containing protein [Streptomycetaceae]|uniref:ParB/Sulfiredoxin domain-containing protein n=1 Tax=Streptantibioticus cattleyicolor (strain ATCC 35852 / DSM 46488 / JCM 4925 / NBRC 14057 / NRRL 8057) TaxID=1003195 RepID=F8JT58_STREN|nr:MULTISPECIES: hypothetical protein [Streptomycetaceae]AEW93003.1 hypothetical protein SCATT_06320 [Streptantibioticus cattleyicolor NRRL 8057 = DSM 46488]MYS57740.1 hypothetical protein [Streptomyces sp. SID5468]CCB73362.1 conserved protein of unknown function [Streptantibioticus cattleyicolor NRRL 8057 = DSM 46488]
MNGKSSGAADGTTGPAARIAIITPEMATEYLRHNTHNRKTKPKHYRQMVRDIANGSWDLNGETIKIAVDGTILDGQHRLTACVEAGRPFTTFIITGLPQEVQRSMDVGARRSMADVLGIEGEKHTSYLAPILRLVWMWDAGDRKFNGNTTPTVTEMNALLARQPQLRRSAEVAATTYRSFRALSPSAVGTAHALCSRTSAGDATWFFARLADGAELPVGHPVYALRRRAQSDRDVNRVVTTATQVAYVIRAWNHLREDPTRDVALIRHSANRDIPEPL